MRRSDHDLHAGAQAWRAAEPRIAGDQRGAWSTTGCSNSRASTRDPSGERSSTSIKADASRSITSRRAPLALLRRLSRLWLRRQGGRATRAIPLASAVLQHAPTHAASSRRAVSHALRREPSADDGVGPGRAGSESSLACAKHACMCITCQDDLGGPSGTAAARFRGSGVRSRYTTHSCAPWC
jgi:hypothetical protein